MSDDIQDLEFDDEAAKAVTGGNQMVRGSVHPLVEGDAVNAAVQTAVHDVQPMNGSPTR